MIPRSRVTLFRLSQPGAPLSSFNTINIHLRGVRGTWGVYLFKCLTLGSVSGCDLRVMGLIPSSTTLISIESAWQLCPPPLLPLALSVKLSKIMKREKKKKVISNTGESLDSIKIVKHGDFQL